MMSKKLRPLGVALLFAGVVTQMNGKDKSAERRVGRLLLAVGSDVLPLAREELEDEKDERAEKCAHYLKRLGKLKLRELQPSFEQKHRSLMACGKAVELQYIIDMIESKELGVGPKVPEKSQQQLWKEMLDNGMVHTKDGKEKFFAIAEKIDKNFFNPDYDKKSFGYKFLKRTVEDIIDDQADESVTIEALQVEIDAVRKALKQHKQIILTL